MAGQRRFRSKGLQSLHDRFVGDDPDRVESFERALDDANVAMSIYKLRTEAGLSQRELAIQWTTASVISRLENADYEGHSMAMLRRVAAALGRKVEVRFPILKEVTRVDASERKVARNAATGRAEGAKGPRKKKAGGGAQAE